MAVAHAGLVRGTWDPDFGASPTQPLVAGACGVAGSERLFKPRRRRLLDFGCWPLRKHDLRSGAAARRLGALVRYQRGGSEQLLRVSSRFPPTRVGANRCGRRASLIATWATRPSFTQGSEPLTRVECPRRTEPDRRLQHEDITSFATFGLPGSAGTHVYDLSFTTNGPVFDLCRLRCRRQRRTPRT